jgi:hypothetical protein
MATVAFAKTDFEQLGYTQVCVPDLIKGQLILLDDQKDDEQGWIVNRILKVPYSENIIVEILPEYANVRTATLFHYGMKNFRIKSLPL